MWVHVPSKHLFNVPACSYHDCIPKLMKKSRCGPLGHCYSRTEWQPSPNQKPVRFSPKDVKLGLERTRTPQLGCMGSGEA